MAGDWIKIQTALSDKPEVWRMSGILGLTPDDVVGKLIRVWSWFDAHTENGHADGVTLPRLDSVAGRDGFCETMCLVGWMEEKGNTLVVPNFDRHNGKTAKNRALASDRKKKERSRSERDESVTREEKRREEKKEQKPEHAQPPAEASPRACRLPKDWAPSEIEKRWAEQERPDLSVAMEADKFRDHWLAKPGRDGSKLDWAATWRNWVRSARASQGFRAEAASPASVRPL